MGSIFALNHLNATFSAKITNFLLKSDFDVSLITDQFIVFTKPDGTTFEKQASIAADVINPSQIISLSAIVGDGIGDVITVTIPATNLLKDGELMTITGTTNFNAVSKPITIISATTFSYQLGSGVGSTSSESSGTVTTPGEKKIVYQNTSPATSILDQIGPWEFGARIVLSNSDTFSTREKTLFWVNP